MITMTMTGTRMLTYTSEIVATNRDFLELRFALGEWAALHDLCAVVAQNGRNEPTLLDDNNVAVINISQMDDGDITIRLQGTDENSATHVSEELTLPLRKTQAPVEVPAGIVTLKSLMDRVAALERGAK